MDNLRTEKLKRFINDRAMAESVLDTIMEAALHPLKGTEKDIHVLAGERLAIDFIRQAWKELDKYKAEPESGLTGGGNVGL